MFLHAFVHWPDRPMDGNPTMKLLTGVPNNMLHSPKVQPTLCDNQKHSTIFSIPIRLIFAPIVHTSKGPLRSTVWMCNNDSCKQRVE